MHTDIIGGGLGNHTFDFGSATFIANTGPYHLQPVSQLRDTGAVLHTWVRAPLDS